MIVHAKISDYVQQLVVKNGGVVVFSRVGGCPASQRQLIKQCRYPNCTENQSLHSAVD